MEKGLETKREGSFGAKFRQVGEEDRCLNDERESLLKIGLYVLLTACVKPVL
jgi:hypothetical protein